MGPAMMFGTIMGKDARVSTSYCVDQTRVLVAAISHVTSVEQPEREPPCSSTRSSPPRSAFVVGSAPPLPIQTPSLTLEAQAAVPCLEVQYHVLKTTQDDPHSSQFDGYYYLISTEWANLQLSRAITIEGLKTATPKVIYEGLTPNGCCSAGSRTWDSEI